MGNHTIECDYCGEDTRGLSGVRGCDTQQQADKCFTYQRNKRNWDLTMYAPTHQPLEASRENTRAKISTLPAFNSEEEAKAYERGAEAMRQRCADYLRQRAEEEAGRKRMITSAACSRLSQEVAAMNIVLPTRAEDW